MSLASTTRTIKFVSKSGTYTAMILCPDGDLVQEYKEIADGTVDVSPSFEGDDQPLLNFVLTSSRASETPVVDNMTYYVNGEKLTFDSDNKNTNENFPGYFKKYVADASHTYCGLQILKNLVEPWSKSAVTVRMEAKVSYGTQEDTIQASYTVAIRPAAVDGHRVVIKAGDDNSFVIKAKDGSCILKATAWQGNSELTQGLSYKWYKSVSGGWELISSATSQTYTVKEADVDSYAEFKVEVYQGSTNLGSDVQGVLDASDPYEVQPNPSPEDETIYEDTSKNGEVKYSPKVVSRDSGTVLTTATKFYFVVRDAAGNILNSDTSGTPAETGTVTREHCIQGSGDVSIMITSVDTEA
jgi:hypothetical protein